MYGKIFEQMYDSTIAVNWQAMVTFQQMIVLADKDGVLDMTPASLSRRTGIPIEIIEAGIEHLESPDKYSRNPEHDGRRIVRLDEHRPWGWQIVSYSHYRDMASRDDKRRKARDRKRKQRAKDRGEDVSEVSRGVTPGHASSRESRHTDADADTDQNQEQPIADSASPNAANDEKRLKGKIGRKAVYLTGRAVDRFNRFWQAFGWKHGKQVAVGAWWSLEQEGEITPEAFPKIIAAAKAERARRHDHMKRGGSPKWAQGWLNDGRFDDEAALPDDAVTTAAAGPQAQADAERKRQEEAEAEELRELSAEASACGALPRQVAIDPETGEKIWESLGQFRLRVRRKSGEQLATKAKEVIRVNG